VDRDAFEKWKISRQKPQFPESASGDPERRQNKLTEQLGNASKKNMNLEPEKFVFQILK